MCLKQLVNPVIDMVDDSKLHAIFFTGLMRELRSVTYIHLQATDEMLKRVYDRLALKHQPKLLFFAFSVTSEIHSGSLLHC